MLPAPKSCVLIDFLPLFYTSFYTTPMIRNAAGTPVNAIRGTVAALLTIMSHPTLRMADYVGAFMDTPDRLFRSTILPSYKARRKEPPEDLLPQFELCESLAERCGLKAMKLEGFEVTVAV